MKERPPILEEIKAELTRKRQEIWRQRQVHTFYRAGRPIFGMFDEDRGKPFVSSLLHWQNRHDMRRHVIRTYKQKNAGSFSVFD